MDDRLILNQCYENAQTRQYLGRYRDMKLVGREYDPDPEYTFELGVETGLHNRYRQVPCRGGVPFPVPPAPPAPANRNLDAAPHRGVLNLSAAHNANSLTMDTYAEGEEVVRLTIQGHAFLFNKAALQDAWNMPGKAPFNPLTNIPVMNTDVIERFTIHLQAGGKRKSRRNSNRRRKTSKNRKNRRNTRCN